jgi:4-hydroxy-3-methylbut-2-enyl diphosphate reductase
MKIVIAKMSGFCMGVRRAVETVLEAPAKQPEPICTYGPLIHNPQVLELLESKGIRALSDIPDAAHGTVLIRAHGVPPDVKKRLKAAGFHVIDATCPRVIRVQSIIRKHARQGAAVIIVGEKDHPEVIGLLGYAGSRGHVAASLEELEALPAFDHAILVAQTTQNTGFYEKVRRWAAAHHPHYKVFDTICDSTERRQLDVQQLAASVDAVIVVGGRESGNTRRLFEIARQSGKPAFHVESEDDLSEADIRRLLDARTIGISAGASTPNWVIRKVIVGLETRLFRQRSRFHKALHTLMHAALLTNLIVALAAGGLCYAAARLQGVETHLPFVLMAFLYVQSMHILNHLTGSRADRYNDPERASFYERHKVLLTAAALACGAAGLLIAFTQGLLPFLVLLIMSLMGLSYNLYLLPRPLGRFMFRRIRDIPGSKTILIAAAWGVATSALPVLSHTGVFGWTNALAALWTAGLVFVRTAFFDILDMQGDRLAGKETIAILLGERRSLRLLKILLGALIAALPLMAGLALIPAAGVVLAACPAAMLVILLAYERGAVLPGLRLEFLVESHMLLGGLLALAWGWAAG